MTCPACLSGQLCDYGLSLSDNIAKKESAERNAIERHRYGGPSPWPQIEDAKVARNELLAHKHGDIPPHERDDRCDCCNMRGVQHEPEGYNVRMRA